jgi:hypothetical protein
MGPSCSCSRESSITYYENPEDLSLTLYSDTMTSIVSDKYEKAKLSYSLSVN